MGTRHRQAQADAAGALRRAPAAEAVADASAAQGTAPADAAWADSPRLSMQGAQLAQLRASAAPAEAHPAGLPEGLRQGVESLAGLDLSHVRVHRNSSKPAALQAHAYAQGSDIHLAPGQEQHLPHEAWHVVQQAKGRVKPTMQMKPGVAVNDDTRLEAEADTMGAKAMSLGTAPSQQSLQRLGPTPGASATPQRQAIDAVAQLGKKGEGEKKGGKGGSSANNDQLKKKVGKKAELMGDEYGPTEKPHSKRGGGSTGSGMHERRDGRAVNNAVNRYVLDTGDRGIKSNAQVRSRLVAKEKDQQSSELRSEKARTQKQAELEAIRQYYEYDDISQITKDDIEAYREAMAVDIPDEHPTELDKYRGPREDDEDDGHHGGGMGGGGGLLGGTAIEVQ